VVRTVICEQDMVAHVGRQTQTPLVFGWQTSVGRVPAAHRIAIEGRA
jgi:hypothetical protein